MIIIGVVQLIILGLQGYAAWKYRDTTKIKSLLLEDWEYVYEKLIEKMNQNSEKIMKK